jgi:thiol-disulfide isomerase/thioredoxin
MLAKIVSIDRFATKGKLVSYFGVFPEENQSGENKHGEGLPAGDRDCVDPWRRYHGGMGRFRLVGRTEALTYSGVAVATVAVAGWLGLREPLPPQPSGPPPAFVRQIQENVRAEAKRWTESKLVHQGWRDVPLAVGSELPSLVAEGWLNGPPPMADDLADHVLVIDVWDEMCGMCSKAAPELVEVYQEYAPQGVIFVGLNPADEKTTAAFMEGSGISWPNGYGAAETIEKLVGAAPTLFVVDSTGRIAWHDSRSRYRHDQAAALPQLRVVLRAVLEGLPVPPPPDDFGFGRPPRAEADTSTANP